MEFTYNINRKPSHILEKVCVVGRDKLVISGNETTGRFSGFFEGNYKVKDNTASIKITRKPLFVSWSMVDTGLKYLVA